MMILDYRANYVVAPAAVPVARRGYRAPGRLSKPKRIADLYTAEIPKSFTNVYIIARGRMFPSKLYFEPRPVPVELPWMNAAVTSQPIWRPRGPGRTEYPVGGFRYFHRTRRRSSGIRHFRRLRFTHRHGGYCLVPDLPSPSAQHPGADSYPRKAVMGWLGTIRPLGHSRGLFRFDHRRVGVPLGRRSERPVA